MTLPQKKFHFHSPKSKELHTPYCMSNYRPLLQLGILLRTGTIANNYGLLHTFFDKIEESVCIFHPSGMCPTRLGIFPQCT